MTLTLRQLEIFEKVASYGHVTQASSELLLTQSAVSMAIAELERLAGAPLFERQGRRLILNDRGRAILPQARDVIQQVHQIDQFLNDSLGEPVGVLTVGASTTIGNYLLPAVVGGFSACYPRAKVLLQVANAHLVENAVVSGEYDLGLIEGPGHDGSLNACTWRQDELVVVVGEKHPWAQAGKVTAEQLEQADWLMREKGSGTREIFEAAMARQGLNFSIAMELGHTEAIKKAAEEGLGVGCLSRIAVQRELEHGWLVGIESPLDLKRSLRLLTRQAEPTKLLQTFLDWLNPEEPLSQQHS
ncbi:LysR family transcriptional regulator [Geomonas silvestris]|uniref:LysR family transcriptional regulator n=1 Tax=Geomonas silvestris TaxID=2740184 RepID=A0A6V8MFL4_9BACT|nr:LysR family transcriptional regulator [Geomonas silvestris]